jgi:hypothetical protein
MARTSPEVEQDDLLEEAFERLGRALPAPVARALRWLHAPASRPVRLPLGILSVLASFFWFLPVIGMELLPIGLLLLAQDVPFLRRPVGRGLIRLLDSADRLMRWWSTRRSRRKRPTTQRGNP